MPMTILVSLSSSRQRALNTPGTRVAPGGRDRTLAIKTCYMIKLNQLLGGTYFVGVGLSKTPCLTNNILKYAPNYSSASFYFASFIILEVDPFCLNLFVSSRLLLWSSNVLFVAIFPHISNISNISNIIF